MAQAMGVLLITGSTEAVVLWCRRRVTRTSSSSSWGPRRSPGSSWGGAGPGGGGTLEKEAMAEASADIFVATLVVVVVVVDGVSLTPLLLPSTLLTSARCVAPPPVFPYMGHARIDALGRPRTQGPLVHISSRPPTSVPPALWSRPLLGSRPAARLAAWGRTTRTPRCGTMSGSARCSTPLSMGRAAIQAARILISTISHIRCTTLRRLPSPRGRPQHAAPLTIAGNMAHGAKSITPTMTRSVTTIGCMMTGWLPWIPWLLTSRGMDLLRREIYPP